MAKYTVNMADQLLKVREKVQEKLKKEAEVVVEIEQPSALQSATADYLSKKEKPHPLSSPKNLNEEQLDEFKKASVEFDRRNKSDMMKAKKDLEKKGHKVDVSGSMITVTAKRGSDIGREIKDVMNFYNGAKRAKALESVEEETLDENVNSDIKKILDREKISYRTQTSKHSLGQKGIITGVFVQAKDEKKAIIALGKVSPYPHTIVVHGEEVELDEAMDKKTAIAILKMKKKEDFYGREGAMIYMSPDERDALKKKVGRLGRDVPGPSKGVSTMIIINTALGKDGTDGNRGDYDTEGKKMINMRKGGKSIGTPRTIGDAMKLAGIREETLGEGKMSQLHMYIKQGKTAKEIGKLMGIDPKTIQKLMSAYDAKKIKEEAELDEQFDYVLLDKDNKIVGRYSGKDAKRNAEMGKNSAHLPPMRIPKNDVKKMKVYPINPKDKKDIGDMVLAIGEAKLIDKPTGEVLKTGSKEEMETERKRNRDELQIKEWFKSKNIDVKVRELEESTQVYVPLGRRIPNEIREELITTQYGKMPEDVKNVKDINYGNFMENSITMNNDFWTKVLHGTKGE